MRAGEFVHVLGDAHVYNTHTEALKEQLMNSPRPFPVSLPRIDGCEERMGGGEDERMRG